MKHKNVAPTGVFQDSGVSNKSDAATAGIFSDSVQLNKVDAPSEDKQEKAAPKPKKVKAEVEADAPVEEVTAVEAEAIDATGDVAE